MEKRIKRKATFREVQKTTIKNILFDGVCKINGRWVFAKHKEQTLANGEVEFFEVNKDFIATCTPREMAIARFHGLQFYILQYEGHKNYLYYLASIGAFSILDKIFRTTDILAKNNKEKDALLSQARDVASARVKARDGNLIATPRLSGNRFLKDNWNVKPDDNIKDATDNKPVSWCEKYLHISIKELLCFAGFMIAVSLFFYWMAT